MADTLVELQNNPEAAEMSHADWLGLLIDREATFRDNRRLSRRLTAAKLRQAATIENIDFRTSRGLDRSLFQTLATSQWVRDCNRRPDRNREVLVSMRPRQQGLPRRLLRPL